jgi:hypothetical protein
MTTGAYKTHDLALAVLLSVNGFEYQLEHLTKRTILWVFSAPEEKEEEIDTLIADYENFEASIEPRKFVARWAEMRRELFAAAPPMSDRRSAPAA